MNYDQQTLVHLRLLAGPHPAGRYLELRYAPRDHAGMRRTAIPATQPARAARAIARLAPTCDVYVGAALRDTPAHGGANAIKASHLVWVEIDQPDARGRLTHFPHPPSLLVSSGTPGHLHAYWQLSTPLGRDELETANRKLAHHLGGDLASVDLARLLRPCASLNHKHTPPSSVRLLAHQSDTRYPPELLTHGLSDPAPRRSRRRPGPWRPVSPLDARLRAIPAHQYARELAGAQPNRAGKLACPFHNDQTPSLQLYPDHSWYCFGCQQGGSIYEFAAALWGVNRNPQSRSQLRRSLAQIFPETRQRPIAHAAAAKRTGATAGR